MPDNQPDSKLRKLYPSLSDEELIVAEEHLEQYTALTARMYDRIQSDPAEYARFRQLVELRRYPEILNLKDGLHPENSANLR
jgi:hypothetical protein